MSIYSRENRSFHEEQRGVGYSTAEHSAELNRGPWWPTPLNPNAVWKDGKLYMHAAMETVMDLIADADTYAEQNDIPAHVHSLIEPSLISALMKRFENNSGKHLLPGRSSEARFLFAKAEVGAATPHELIALLDDAPELGSVELAKMSHPYEWRVTREMDEAVVDAVFDNGIAPPPRGDDPRYYFARADDLSNPRAIVVIRKEPLGSLSGTNNQIKVMKRDSYVVDLMHPSLDHVHYQAYREFLQWLTMVSHNAQLRKAIGGGGKLHYEGEELTSASEAALRHNAHEQYLYPTASSYYAYIPS